MKTEIALYAYILSNIRVIDGDSIEATLDRGMGDSSRKIIRMYGIDAPESRTRNKEEKKKGLASKDWLLNTITNAESDSIEIVIQSHKKGSGKYGRLLGTLIIDGEDINKSMVDLGLAKEYHGGKRK